MQCNPQQDNNRPQNKQNPASKPERKVHLITSRRLLEVPPPGRKKITFASMRYCKFTMNCCATHSPQPKTKNQFKNSRMEQKNNNEILKKKLLWKTLAVYRATPSSPRMIRFGIIDSNSKCSVICRGGRPDPNGVRTRRWHHWSALTPRKTFVFRQLSSLHKLVQRVGPHNLSKNVCGFFICSVTEIFTRRILVFVPRSPQMHRALPTFRIVRFPPDPRTDFLSPEWILVFISIILCDIKHRSSGDRGYKSLFPKD